MELWYPPKDQPQLFEWWRPLILASRAARLDQFPWPINIDEMILVGRVDRGSRPAIWVYRNPECGGEIYIDSTGQPYRFTRTPNAKSFGRFTPCEIRTALWRAGLPQAVAPVWYEEPSPARHSWSVPDLDDELDDHEDDDGADTGGEQTDGSARGAHPTAGRDRKPRRHGHLTVHDGGRPLAG